MCLGLVNAVRTCLANKKLTIYSSKEYRWVLVEIAVSGSRSILYTLEPVLCGLYLQTEF